MRTYEFTVVTDGEFDTAGFLKKAGVKLLKEEKPVERSFAYPISKVSKGVYAYVEFEAEPSQIAELEAKIKLEPKILRHLLIVKE